MINLKKILSHAVSYATANVHGATARGTGTKETPCTDTTADASGNVALGTNFTQMFCSQGLTPKQKGLIAKAHKGTLTANDMVGLQPQDLLFGRKDGTTILHYAANTGNPGQVHLILSKAPELAGAITKNGLMALNFALNKGHFLCVGLILNVMFAGEKPTPEQLAMLETTIQKEQVKLDEKMKPFWEFFHIHAEGLKNGQKFTARAPLGLDRYGEMIAINKRMLAQHFLKMTIEAQQVPITTTANGDIGIRYIHMSQLANDMYYVTNPIIGSFETPSKFPQFTYYMMEVLREANVPGLFLDEAPAEAAGESQTGADQTESGLDGAPKTQSEAVPKIIEWGAGTGDFMAGLARLIKTQGNNSVEFMTVEPSKTCRALQQKKALENRGNGTEGNGETPLFSVTEGNILELQPKLKGKSSVAFANEVFDDMGTDVLSYINKAGKATAKRGKKKNRAKAKPVPVYTCGLVKQSLTTEFVPINSLNNPEDEKKHLIAQAKKACKKQKPGVPTLVNINSDRALATLKQALRPGGIGIVTDYSPERKYVESRIYGILSRKHDPIEGFKQMVMGIEQPTCDVEMPKGASKIKYDKRMEQALANYTADVKRELIEFESEALTHEERRDIIVNIGRTYFGESRHAEFVRTANAYYTDPIKETERIVRWVEEELNNANAYFNDKAIQLQFLFTFRK